MRDYLTSLFHPTNHYHQSGAPVNARTCKHLKATLGEKYEMARLKMKNPDGQTQVASKPSTKGKRKRADADDDEDGEEETASPKKKAKATAPELLLANKWDLVNGTDPTGWWASEKLDGVRYVVKFFLYGHMTTGGRVYYDGNRMMSRLGNAFTPPKEFLDSEFYRNSDALLRLTHYGQVYQRMLL